MNLFLIFSTSFIIQLIISMEMNAVGPLAPYLATYFNIPSSSVIMLNIGFSLIAFIIPIFGAWADKHGKKKYIIISLISFIFGTIISGFSQNSLLFAIGRTFSGMGYFSLNASIISYISDFIPYEKRGKASGVLRTAFALAILFSPLYSAFMTQKFNNLWSIYIPLSLVGLMVLIAITKFPESNKVESKNLSVKSIISLLDDKTSLKLLVAEFLLLTAPYLMYSYLGIWLKSDFDLEQLKIGYIYTIAASGTVLGVIISTFFTDKIGKEKFSKIFFSLMIISLIPLPYVKSVYGIMPIVFLFSFGLDGAFTAFQTLCSEVCPKQRTTFMTLFFFTNSLTITVFTLLGPLLYNLGGFKLTINIASLFAIIGLAIFSSATKEKKLLQNS